MTAETYPLVVVGAGPVGLTAALAARHHQLRVLVVEAEPEDRIRPGSRATFLFRETLDLLEQIAPGVTAQIVDRSNSWHSLRTTYAGKAVYFKKFPPSTPGKFGASISQRETEEMLLSRCRQEGVEFHWNAAVSGVESSATGVTLALPDGNSVRTSYVVGADGARSAVRRAVGIELDGDRSDSNFIIADVDEDPTAPMELTRTFHYRHPAVGGRNVLMVPFGGGWRIDLECLPGEDATPWIQEPLRSQWIGAVAGAKYADKVSWVSTYRFNRSVARSYTDKHARVVLAGEAAHLFPPFGGGRGLNSGVPDAVLTVEAIANALANPDAARHLIATAAEDRRRAGLANRDAAAAALTHMEAASWPLRTRQRLAAMLAPWFSSFGAWLDRGPMGPNVPVTERSRF